MVTLAPFPSTPDQPCLGRSAAARELERLLTRLAGSTAGVLLLGETGVGKSFVARLLHERGPRASEPLRVVNCGAIPEPLAESELFGHERGAFSGAVASRAGALEAAGRGTVFLDEIGELPLASQAKLLRALDERRFERVGSNETRSLDARIVVATNRPLERMVHEGAFREDLFYRLAVVTLTVPPLRERPEDLVPLAYRFLKELAPTAGRPVTGFSFEALEALRRYAWPGNARELRNVVERALALGGGAVVDVDDLPASIRDAVPAPAIADPLTIRLPARLDELERRAIAAAMLESDGNRTRAAAMLGISRQTLHKKLRGASAP